MSEEDIYYVQIEKPQAKRKEMLESLRDVVTTLQRFEKFKEIRVLFEQKKLELKKMVKEIKSLNAHLKKELPNIKTEEKKGIVKPKRIVNVSKKKKTKTESELERLESQLSDIEGKLDTLL